MIFINARLDNYSLDYEIRDELWQKLSDFIDTNEYYRRINEDTLMFIRDKYFHDFIEKEATTISEIHLMREIRKLSNNANIRLRRLYVINTFNRICNHVNGDYAYFSRANASKGLYKVLVSDKVRGLVRSGDNCEIKVLPNGIWIVADIVRTDDLETQLMKFKDLGGNY